jgi:hypothetical protein
MLNVAPYRPAEAAQWDQCVRDSECACILFHRGYMDYHADRFADASLIARLGDRLVGVFPASVGRDGVSSHGGLTFGGWQFVPGLPLETRRQVHMAALARYRHDGYTKLVIRAMPGFFQESAGPDEWWRPGLTEVRSLTGAAADLSAPEKLGIKRKPCAVKALNAHEFAASSAEEFWPLLEEVLSARHGVAPTHSRAEMLLLQGRFPGQIRTFKASQDQRMLAGVMLFVSRDVAHVQYMATSLAGRASHALDGLLVWLMRAHVGRLRWLSMGTSNEKDGQINQGLLNYKLSFGATPFAHDVREYDLTA